MICLQIKFEHLKNTCLGKKLEYRSEYFPFYDKDVKNFRIWVWDIFGILFLNKKQVYKKENEGFAAFIDVLWQNEAITCRDLSRSSAP